MGKLFPGVPRLKKTPAQIATENPSLLLGFLPVIGGAITTPMQLSEINRATTYQSAADHYLKLLAVKTNASRFARGASATSSNERFSPVVAVSRKETREVVGRHLQRRRLLELMARNRAGSPRSLRPPLEMRSVASRLQVRLPVRRFEGILSLNLRSKPLQNKPLQRSAIQRSAMQRSSQPRA